MKQGQATHSGSGSTKIEPISTAINPAYAGEIGVQMHRPEDRSPMSEGRGLKAPMVSTTQHHAGSQGKHK